MTAKSNDGDADVKAADAPTRPQVMMLLQAQAVERSIRDGNYRVARSRTVELFDLIDAAIKTDNGNAEADPTGRN